MRRALMLTCLILPLSGCYVPPPDYAQPGYPPGYGQPGYPPPGYPPPNYAQPGYPPPGYPQPAYDPYANVYPGYSENDGAPSLLVEGALVPLIVVGGGWGYWDSRHNWHRAPDAVQHHLEAQHAAGGGFHHGGEGFGRPGPDGRPPAAGSPGGGFSHAAGPARPAPAHEEHERGRECQPGRKC